MNIANDQGIEPFQVFHNSSLEEMATIKPTTHSEFLSVSGVGPVKLEQYGDSFLQVIRDYLGEESSVDDESSAYDHILFEKLRSLRNSIANDRSLPAYFIFNNDSLKDMATSKPKTRKEFLKISGVGPAKLEEYGDAFLACIRLYLNNM
jgi:ATP-dependent DNA helicase RecQ